MGKNLRTSFMDGPFVVFSLNCPFALNVLFILVLFVSFIASFCPFCFYKYPCPFGVLPKEKTKRTVSSMQLSNYMEI